MGVPASQAPELPGPSVELPAPVAQATAGPTPTAEAPAPSPEAPALEIPCAEMPEGDEPLVAIVSGREIGRTAFDREMAQFLFALQAGGADLTGPEVQARLPEFRRQVLELLIEDVLIQQAAVEAGIGVSEESVEARGAAQVEEGGGLELFQDWLEQTGQSWGEVRRDTCQALLAAQIQAAVTRKAAESQADQQAAAFQRWLEERRRAADVQVLVDLEH